MNPFCFGIVFLLGTVMISSATETRFESSPQQTALVELYTSEGCSSCPPAEAWMSRWKNDPGLWKQFVPVAFHVDYWDRLGWRDRYSSPEFTARQSRYAALWNSESVYTPAFVLNGKELRSGLGRLDSPNEQRTGMLRATSKDGKTWAIEFHPAQSGEGNWDAHIALLGAGISAKIGGGENGGRNLQHDFVVLGEQSIPLQTEGDHVTASLTIKAPQESA